MTESKRVFKTAGVYISLVLGAGFASGQELFTFFVSYGSKGLIGLFISGFVLAICGWAVMDITVRLDINGYGEFMNVVLGRRFGPVMVFIANIFIGVMLAIMFAGFGETLRETFSFNYTAGVLIIAVLCFITFLFDLKGIIGISSVLAPLLVVGGVFFGLYSVFTSYSPVFLNLGALKKSFVWSALVYASYNIITAASVLSTMGKTVKNRKTAKKAGLLSGFCLCLLGVCFIAPMYLNLDVVTGVSLPMLRLAASYGGAIEIIYLVILAAAIFTTAVSSGFAVIEWLYGRLKVNKLLIKIIVTASGAALAHIGFTTFVEKAYPLFGYIGLFQIILIIVYFLFGKKEKQ